MERFRPYSQYLLILGILAILIGRGHILFNISGQLLGNYSDFLHISLFLSDLLILLMVGISLYIGGLPLSPEVKKSRILPYVLGYLWANFIISPHETLYNYYFSLRVVLFFALTYSIYTTWKSSKRSPFQWIYGFFSIAGVIETLIAIMQFLRQRSLGLYFIGEAHLSMESGIAKIDTLAGKFIRPYGTFAHPNILAAFLVVACATSLMLGFSSGIKTKIFGYASLFVNIFGVFLSFSRAGIGAAFLTLLLIVILFYAKQKIALKPILITSGLVLLFFAGCGGLLSKYLVSRATISDASTANRITYDKIGLKIFAAHPLFGVGLGNVVPEVGKSTSFQQTWQIQPPHNYFLLVADETGIIGLILILFIFFVLLKTLWRNSSDPNHEVGEFNIFLFAAFCGIIFLMQFDHYFYDLQQGQLLLWVVVSMIISQSRAYNLVVE